MTVCLFLGVTVTVVDKFVKSLTTVTTANKQIGAIYCFDQSRSKQQFDLSESQMKAGC